MTGLSREDWLKLNAAPTCADCKFVLKIDEHDKRVFECHRMPPPWTEVRSGDSCGEYKENGERMAFRLRVTMPPIMSSPMTSWRKDPPIILDGPPGA